MGWQERLKAMLGREVDDAREWADEVGSSADAELSRRERELAMTPEERLQQSIQANEDDDPLAAVRDRIAQQQARAAAHAELQPDDEVLEGEVVEGDEDEVDGQPGDAGPDSRG